MAPPLKAYPKPYELAWPLTAHQLDGINEMFRTLFKAIKHTASSVNDLSTTASSSALVPGTFVGQIPGITSWFDAGQFTETDWLNPATTSQSIINTQVSQSGTGFVFQDYGDPFDDFSWGFRPTTPSSNLFTQGSVVFADASGNLNQNNAKFFWDNTNFRLGIGTASPSADLHLPAGTASASTAPLKFTAGTNLTSPEIGAMEFTDDGTTGHLYITLHQGGVVTRVQIV